MLHWVVLNIIMYTYFLDILYTTKQCVHVNLSQVLYISLSKFVYSFMF
jgi:hypothetical protein